MSVLNPVDDPPSVGAPVLPIGRARVSLKSIAYWVLQLGVWGSYFWWQASGEVIFASVPWTKAATVWGSFCLSGIALTQLLRVQSKRKAWLALPAGALLRRAIASALILAVLGFAVIVVVSSAIYGSPVAAMLQTFYRRLPVSNRIFNEFLLSLSVYVTWVAAYFGVTTIRHRYQVELRQAKLAEALRAAELRLLESQLNPHFLFNALNGVRALIADEPARAQDALTQLARTLRYTLAAGREQLVSLGQELEMTDDYLALESLRLADRLRVVREIEPEAAQARIPVMLLQTLVENAIKHGIAPLREGGVVRIAACMTATELTIEVENPRPPGEARPPTIGGVGLKNAAERLRLLFGAAASLELDLSDRNRARTTVRIRG